jgi:DNA polymerase-4
VTQPVTHQRWVGHADLDAFYASIQERIRRECRSRPVVVGALPGHRGVVAAANCRVR